MENTMQLSKHNEDFVKLILEQDPDFFSRLKDGQAPEFFILACSDSRVSPSIITNMQLGNLFVHRNIANQVKEDDASFSASLYYALAHLKVKKIVIKGHTGCGGVAAACGITEEPYLKEWTKDLSEKFAEKKNIGLDERARENVLIQVENLKNHPVYKEFGNDTEIIGCLFDVGTGKLERIN